MSTEKLQIDKDATTFNIATEGLVKTINIGTASDTININGLVTGTATTSSIDSLAVTGSGGGAAVMVGSSLRTRTSEGLVFVYGYVEWSSLGTIGPGESIRLTATPYPTLPVFEAVFRLYETNGINDLTNRVGYLLIEAGVPYFQLRYQNHATGDMGDITGMKLEASGKIRFHGFTFDNVP